METNGINAAIGNRISGYWNGYYYAYPYATPDYTLTSRVAQLEGEVKVLREMVVALLSGRAQKAPAKR